jgi:uncharacterized protein (TIGR02145 family)
VGIGTSTPNAKLNGSGSLKLADVSEGVGKIITSDATSLASWQMLPTLPETNYPSVTICGKRWMTQNLNVKTYRNGDPIPHIKDNAKWAASTIGAYCYYQNDKLTYGATYGKLYNWYAVNDPRGLAPEGWHIPTDIEWTTLGDCLGGEAVAGGPMKEIGTTHWNSPNTGATNSSGFKGLPGGFRSIDASTGMRNGGYWWSSTGDIPNGIAWAYYRQLAYTNDDLYRYSNGVGNLGFSVRCVSNFSNLTPPQLD